MSVEPSHRSDQERPEDIPAASSMLKADPDRLVSKLRSYSRSKTVIHPNEWEDQGWDGKRGGKINMITQPSLPIWRVMRDLYGSNNILEEGYIITEIRKTRDLQEERPPEERDNYKEREYVWRVELEPVSKFLIYAYFGHFGYLNGWTATSPSK